MGKVRKHIKEVRKQFDAEVKVLFDKGYENREIAILLGVHTNKVSASVARLTGFDKRRTERFDPEKEANFLINAKMAPTFKPKAKKVRVDGWENGKYVHYTAYDVSEFWGL